MPGIIILIVLVVLVIAFSFSGNYTFKSGTVSFEYPKTWSQDQMIGNFNSTSLYSQVTLTTNYQDSSGQNQPAYIIIQMQQVVKGALNLPSTGNIVMNTSNSSVGSVSVNNVSATQVGNFGNNIGTKYTIIMKNNNYYIITYICPPFAVNQTEKTYNGILSTLNIQ